jgi:hypothetical protein
MLQKIYRHPPLPPQGPGIIYRVYIMLGEMPNEPLWLLSTPTNAY